MKRLIPILLICLSTLLVGTANAASRSFHLGLADNMYDNTVDAITSVWGYIAQDSDMIVYHDDRDGVPWTEAYWNLPYSEKYQGRIDLRKSAQVHLWNTHKRYLALTPLNFVRNDIAPQYDAQTHPDWAGFWASQPLNADVVKIAYYNHLSRLIDAYQPHYLAYAVEANILINTRPDKWAEFVDLVQYIHSRLKTEYPGIKLMITFQAEAFYDGFSTFPQDPYLHYRAMTLLFAYTDLMAISSYPYMKYKTPEELPADYFTAIAALAPDKPFVIAETGWPAESLDPPYDIPSDIWKQQSYINRVMNDLQSRNGLFVISLLPRDYDALWDKVFKVEPDAFLLRLWRDMGLYDGSGNVRPALESWRARLTEPFYNLSD